MKMLLCHLLILISLTSTYGQLTWQQIPSPVLLPDARRDAGFGYDATRNQLVLFGGRPGPLDDTWIFDISAGTWRAVNTSPRPAARFSFISGLQGDYFYVSMGEGVNKQFYNDVWRFSLVTETWESLPSQNAPEARYGAAGGIHSTGTNLFVSLGFSSRRYFDTYSYNVVTQTWSAEFCAGYACNPYDPNYPHARCLHAGAMADPNQLVIFGGCMSGGLTGGPCPAGDSWSYSGQTNSWTRIDGCPTPRNYGTLAMIPSSGGERRMVLFGGVEEHRQVISTTSSDADEVSVLDPDNFVWYRQKANYQTSPPAKRASASMATTSTGVYMFGGLIIESGDAANDLWFLNGTVADTKTATMLPCTEHFANWILLHGIFMTFGWGIFLTWGALIARYFNGKGKLWFQFHVSFQVIGLVLSLIGLAFAIRSVLSKHFMFAHGAIGLLVMILGLLQPLNACFRGKRPDEGETKTLRRQIWEYIHHYSGRVAVVLALINICLGVFFAVVTTTFWALWYTYFALLLALVLVIEIVRLLTKFGYIQPRICKSNNHTAPEENLEFQESPEKTNQKNSEENYDTQESTRKANYTKPDENNEVQDSTGKANDKNLED